MSIQTDIDLLNDEQRDKIHHELILKIQDNKYNKFAPPKEIYPYEIKNNYISLPFSYSITELGMKRKTRDNYSAMEVKFEGTLREEQEEIRKESISYLSKTGSVIISLYTGGGKSITSLALACHIKLKTLIIVNKVVLINQWEESIKSFCPSARINKLVPKSKYDDEADFYIINAVNMNSKELGFFDDIGCVIVDEVHLIMAETLSKSLFYVFPRYLIGLSATPYRTDGLDPLLDFYFGKNKIIRELKREHIVYRVKTGFKPKVEMATNGKINWGVVLDSQSNDKERNELIIKIAKENPDRNILIMSKRIEQATYIFNRLEEDGESVTNLIGKKQEFDKEARILVGTTSKTGTGFDHKKLDCLILGSDLENYFIQVLGRVLRRPDVKPIVFDLVDENPILEKHYRTRKSVYLEIGGKIMDYEKKKLLR